MRAYKVKAFARDAVEFAFWQQVARTYLGLADDHIAWAMATGELTEVDHGDNG